MFSFTTQLKPGDTGAEVAELHAHLIAVGHVINSGEQSKTEYGPTTVSAVRAVRQQFGLPTGDAVDLPTARLIYVAAVFAGNGNRAALSAAVREVVDMVDGDKQRAASRAGGRAASRAAVREAVVTTNGGQPQALYWLARYATIAGEYQTAKSIAQRIPDHPEVKTVINPILGTADQEAQPAQLTSGQTSAFALSSTPEMSYPENFYAYRRDFYPLDALSDAQRQIAAVGEPPRSANQAYPPSGSVGASMIQAAVKWFEALKQWQIGNDHLNHQRYAAAQAAYDACQWAVCDYFSNQYSINVGNGSILDRLANVIKHIGVNESSWATVWSRISWRRSIITLDQLRAWDWPDQPPSLYNTRLFTPSPLIGTLPPLPDYGLGFVQKYFRRGEFGEDPAVTLAKQTDLESRLITLAFVLAPLARAEASRALRHFDAAIRDLRWVIDSVLIRTIPPLPEGAENVIYIYARIACEFIELPFARLLLAETLLEKADAEYKARIAAATAPAPDVTDYQGLKAAQTYLAIKDEFEDEGEYVARVNESVEQLTLKIQERLTANDTSSPEFQILGKASLVPTVESSSPSLPGLDRKAKIHEPLLKFVPPSGQPAMREINPRVYAVLLSATARLEQLKAGFNYLGYLDTYTPPWRFQVMLERARYFATNARNAQREFLNFLGNAEREGFQESSASQSVEMEKSNVRIETARVDQVRFEVAAANQSKLLADLTAAHSEARFDNYKQFDDYADSLFGTDTPDPLEFLSEVANFIPGVNPVLTAVGDIFTGGAISNRKQTLLNDAQREIEKKNLELARVEALQAAVVAGAQLATARAGLVVAGLQRQAALLRHEFALQNLEYLRNRVLSAEQWYRLAAAIRSISETYLRYSVELAFLAEQAYEFEADKRINVIRYDYDLSEVGDFLAADFLLRDLDTLEQDLIVTQRQRQQQVRYVLSMAREFPEALQEIRDTGKASFSLRLEQLEKRFPGLYNLRIGAVDVLPVALMDSTRFSLELTHLGASQLRLKAQQDTPIGTQSASPLNTNDLPIPEGGWLADLQEAWPIKLRVTGPETSVFSGLTRQDANAVFPFATTNQRHAFEGLGAAAAWQVDFTARENQVVPGTLADLLITFTLSGYHDPELRNAIDQAPRPTTAVTRWFSGRSILPDAFYEFNRSGRMVWKVTRNLLTLADNLGAVRNAALLLLPKAGGTTHFGRAASRCETRIRITSTGNLEILSEIPQVTFTLGGVSNSLRLTAKATLPPGAGEISWDFGDGSARQSGAEQQHLYAKPGRYTVTLRVVRNSRLSEFRADVVVSRSHADRIIAPLTAFPTLTRVTGADIPPGHTRVRCAVNSPANDPVIANWRIGDQGTEKGNIATFDLEPGDYTLFFTATRILKARVYCSQRHLPGPLFDFNGLSLATNRRFDLNGTDVTGTGDNPPPNALAAHLFGNGALSPVDEWTAELPLSNNACLRSVSATDVEQYGLAEIQDVVLALEYETTPENS